MSGWLAPSAGFELGNDGPRTIVAGIDGSPSSLRALAYAAGLARRDGADLVAVHVHTPRTAITLASMYGVDYTGAAVRSAAELEALQDAELEAEAADLARCWGIRARLRVRHGDRLRELAAVADELHADMVIVGASRRFGSRRPGSLAVRLVRHRSWPVTVVP